MKLKAEPVKAKMKSYRDFLSSYQMVSESEI